MNHGPEPGAAHLDPQRTVPPDPDWEGNETRQPPPLSSTGSEITVGEEEELDEDIDLSEDTEGVELMSERPQASNGAASPAPPQEIIDASPISNRNYISDQQFDAARGRPATIPAASATRHHSSQSLFSVVSFSTMYQLEIQDHESLTDEQIGDLRTLLVKQEWLVDEDQLRKAMVVVLTSLNATLYPPDGEWSSQKLDGLREIFLKALRASDNEALRIVASKLAGDPEPKAKPEPPKPPRRRTKPPAKRETQPPAKRK